MILSLGRLTDQATFRSAGSFRSFLENLDAPSPPLLMLLFQAGPAMTPPAGAPVWYGKDVVREHNVSSWFRQDDYPREAKRLHEEGRAVVTTLVAADGTPIECWVQTSSGYPDLDAISCQFILRRGAFTRTAADYTWTMPVRWSLGK